ncbi:MAG: arginase family protein [Bacteroidetes bacterium]|nr:arginase family protein [Bacteroidota bacterium]
MILIGCGERRGQKPNLDYSHGPDKIREELYRLHYWHPQVKIGDIGNVMQGASLDDTRAALRTHINELMNMGKKVVILGGSHDLTLQQYEVFKERDEIIDFTIIDMLADVAEGNGSNYDDYLMTALTSSPNYVRHFNLIGFQSYYVNPNLVEALDKLRFDCIRVGMAREDIEQLEPAIRNSHLLSIDMNAVRYSDAPANKMASPNGFFGDEMCKLTRFAGMSSALKSFGIYGYMPELDQNNLTAKLISQMLWYYIDGIHVGKREASLDDREQFLEYQVNSSELNTLFLKSKKTNRWWMQMPDERFVACTHKDYLIAAHNDIPERWLREMERMV